MRLRTWLVSESALSAVGYGLTLTALKPRAASRLASDSCLFRLASSLSTIFLTCFASTKSGNFVSGILSASHAFTRLSPVAVTFANNATGVARRSAFSCSRSAVLKGKATIAGPGASRQPRRRVRSLGPCRSQQRACEQPLGSMWIPERISIPEVTDKMRHSHKNAPPALK